MNRTARTLTTTAAALALALTLTACGADKAAPGAAPGSVPAPTATAAAPTPTVTKAPAKAHATDAAVVARYGQDAADAAVVFVGDLGMALATADAVDGTLKGNDVVGVVADYLDKDLYDEVRKTAPVRDSLVLGNLPYAATLDGAPVVKVGQPSETTEGGTPRLYVPLTVTATLDTEEWGKQNLTRRLGVYLTQQADNTWAASGFKAAVDTTAPAGE